MDPANGSEDQERRRERLTALSLSTWELEKRRSSRPATPRARATLLRSQQRLQAELEERQGVPPEQRSIILPAPDATDSVLLIHGATGTPAELRGLAEFLAGSGLNAYCPLMPGHAKVGSALDDVLWRACLQEIRLRYRLLADVSRRVHVVGLSFGAALALHLAREESPHSLVLLAPALEPRLSIFARLLLRLGAPKLQWVRRRYGWRLQILEAMEKARPLLGHVQAPVYAAHCADDTTISPRSLRLLQKKLRNPSSRFRLFPTGGHLILQAHGEETLYREILNFVQDT